MNNNQVVVGYCDSGVGGSLPTRGFVWKNGTMYRLNDLIPPGLKIDIDVVWAINNAGQIAGGAVQYTAQGIYNGHVAIRLTPIPRVPGDVNCDQIVNMDDLLGVITHWGETSAPGSNPADLNGDGIVNLSDLMLVLDNWS